MFETFSNLWAFSAKRHNKLLSALALSFVRSSFSVTQLVAIIAAVQVLTGTLEPGAGVIRVVVCTLICVLCSFLTSYFEQISSLESGMYSVADQRTDCARLLRRVPLGFFSQSAAKNIVATLTTTLSGVETAATMAIVGIVSGFFTSAAMFLFMLWYDWKIGLLMGVGILVYLLVLSWQVKDSRKNAPARQRAQTGLTSAALTFLQGIKVTKAFRFGTGDEELKAAIDASSAENIRLTDRSMPSQVAAHLSIAVFESLLMGAVLYFTFVNPAFGVEKAVVLLMFSFFAYGALNQAGSILSMIGMIESGLNEVNEIKDTSVLPEEDGGRIPESDRVELDRVSFSYGDNQVLREVSASFCPHTLTAIIGPSGSGKTTLCRLIARFQDVDSGAITIGGVDVRNIPYEKLMEKISIVFQNVYLFEDTILNNIRFGCPDATLEQVREAARAARCDDFILSLPQGYDTMVQEGGSNLSGGEKQRISIARAILKDSPIIILDEATSALDAENERAFFDAVDELIENKTVIMIAHRLSTVERADCILSLKDGAVVQSGTPAVLRGEPGLYADFLASRREAAGWKLKN